MSQSTDDVDALWRAVFGEPPPMRADHRLLCELLVRYLPPAPPYAPAMTSTRDREGSPCVTEERATP